VSLIKKRLLSVATPKPAIPAIPEAQIAGIARLRIASAPGSKTQVGSKRERFRFAAQKLDELTELFGPGVRVAYARQGDDEIGQRLLTHEVGGPSSRIEPDVVPVDGCECSACRRKRKPTKTDIKRMQREPGGAFGLDRYKRFKQHTTYRADLVDERWEAVAKWMRSRRTPVIDDDGGES
jgi:hypothetical protein